MNRTLQIGASGMLAQQLRTDNIANNMANVNTTAFKKGVMHFQDMLYETIAAPGAQSSKSDTPVSMQMGTGVRMQSASKNFTQGPLTASSGSLDIAIEGNGFFQVVMPNGNTAYTRSGTFHQDSTGRVVTAEGYELLGFPTLGTNVTNITINPDGNVSVETNNQTQTVGRIQLARFTNPEGLNYLGHNLYQETTSSGTAMAGSPTDPNFGSLAQYFLESSNVEIVEEMVDLIASQRAYELNSKSVKSADDMLRIVAGLK